jgi:hypothetical protein
VPGDREVHRHDEVVAGAVLEDLVADREPLPALRDERERRGRQRGHRRSRRVDDREQQAVDRMLTAGCRDDQRP